MCARVLPREALGGCAPQLLSFHRALQDAQLVTKGRCSNCKALRLGNDNTKDSMQEEKTLRGTKRWKKANSQCISQMGIGGNHNRRRQVLSVAKYHVGVVPVLR
jgi:hypothetical protein